MNIVATDQGIGRVDGSSVELLDLKVDSVSSLLRHADWRSGIISSPVVERHRLDDVRLKLPIVPGDFWLVGSNYPGRSDPPPKEPAFYLRSSASISGPSATVLNEQGADLDPDGELAVVIGSPTYRVPEKYAWSHVAAVTACNDLTARSRLDGGRGAATAKSGPGFGAVGSSLKIVEGDPGPLAVSLTVDGQNRQVGTTSDMLFGVPELIARLSHMCPLNPGDIIATGAPMSVHPREQQPPSRQTMHVDVADVLSLITHVVPS